MAYCPRCGREQRCGCDECHECGVRLVEGRDSALARPVEYLKRAAEPAGGEVAPLQAEAPDRPRSALVSGSPVKKEAGRKPESRASIVPALVAVLGCAVFAVALIEMARAAHGMVGIAGATLTTGMFKQLGYFLGGALYPSTFRFFLAFALLFLALFNDPPLPFRNHRSWERSVLACAVAMAVTGAAFVVSAVLAVMPDGVMTLALKNVLPSLWWALPVMLLSGGTLLWGGYYVATRAVERRGTRKTRAGPARGAAPGD